MDFFNLTGLSSRQLQPKDVPALQALLERASDYVQLVTGSPPGPSAGDDLFQQGPPGRPLSQKILIGLFRPGDNLVGVIDAFRDHPAPGEWWLGLLLLEPRERDQGLGRSVYDQFEGWAAAQGATTIWLSVVERNKRAHDFWGRLGFEEVERRPLAASAGNPGTVIVMKRRVA